MEATGATLADAHDPLIAQYVDTGTVEMVTCFHFWLKLILSFFFVVT